MRMQEASSKDSKKHTVQIHAIAAAATDKAGKQEGSNAGDGTGRPSKEVTGQALDALTVPPSGMMAKATAQQSSRVRYASGTDLECRACQCTHAVSPHSCLMRCSPRSFRLSV
jgi:hypothetical protein